MEHRTTQIPLSYGSEEPVTSKVTCIGCHVITVHDAVLKSTAVNSNNDWASMYTITQKYQEYPSTILLEKIH